MQNNPNSEYKIPETIYTIDSSTKDEPIDKVALNNVYGLYDFSDKNETYLEEPKATRVESKDVTIQRLNEICTNIEKARFDRLNKYSKPTRRSKSVKIFTGDIAKLFFNRNLSEESYKIHAKNELIARESAIGASVFGLKTDGYNRNEFFCEGRDASGIDSWFFHQEIINPSTSKSNTRTLHYEVLPNGILLVGHDYLKSEELKKFILATEMYYELVMKKLYSGADPEILNRKHGKRAA